MKENMITVLKIEVGEPPEIKEIPNELSGLQHEVGGLIECVYLDDGSIAVCNEEGKLNGITPLSAEKQSDKPRVQAAPDAAGLRFFDSLALPHSVAVNEDCV